MTVSGWLTRATTSTVTPDPAFHVLEDAFTGADPATRAGLARRINTLLGALGHSVPLGEADLVASLYPALEMAGPPELWLALAVLIGALPDSATLVQTVRAAELDGPIAALGRALSESGQLGAERWSDVEVVTGSVVVDVHHTSRTEVSTGIQRVARETVRRWNRDHDVIMIGWTFGYRALRRLDAGEIQWVLNGPSPRAPTGSPEDGAGGANEAGGASVRDEPTVVPWRCTLLLPELPAEADQARRYQALARYSGSTTGVIGYDCVPLMASETSAEGMAEGFALYLGAAAHFDRLAAISNAAATEYEGWRAMLAGTARRGPEVRAIALTVEASTPSEAAMEAARDLITIDTLPTVLAVGSHEPRKNHLAVIQAAELLWRDGLRFSLTFVGGHAWKSEVFAAQVQALQGIHRPIQTIRGLSDELLWAAYRVAYCTVFVSVHEGFGLPAAESLASGTPVITSNFGSMLEIAANGGAIVVDPADDDAITSALRRILEQQSLRDRLADEAAALQWRSWDDYARETWDFLTGSERA